MYECRYSCNRNYRKFQQITSVGYFSTYKLDLSSGGIPLARRLLNTFSIFYRLYTTDMSGIFRVFNDTIENAFERDRRHTFRYLLHRRLRAIFRMRETRRFRQLADRVSSCTHHTWRASTSYTTVHRLVFGITGYRGPNRFRSIVFVRHNHIDQSERLHAGRHRRYLVSREDD